MFERTKILGTMALLAVLSVVVHGAAFSEETEKDSCTCKRVQVGAKSTLKGGVCQRTEANNCLMEWGSTSDQKVNVGNGAPQLDSALKAEQLILKVDGKFKVIPIFDISGALPPLRIALRNLAIVPPQKYGTSGIIESFLLVSAAALSRFDAPITDLSKGMLFEDRKRMIKILSSSGEIDIGSFHIEGVFGCMKVFHSSGGNDLAIYIKSPFASDESC